MSVEFIFSLIFYTAGFGLFHTYFLYPVTLWVAALFCEPSSSNLPKELPDVTLIVAAYNEEEIISKKIENCLELEYPDNKLDIVVFSDASDDQTDKIVRSYESDGVELVRIEGRVGKTECQNQVVEQVNTDIFVFSDANSMYESNAILELIRGFGSGVGCVVGELRYRASSAVEGESVYWQYESMIKRLESRVHSLVTGNGSIYAIKTESYVSLPRDAISDFAEPLGIVKNDELVKYAPNAVAWEDTGDSTASELRRRVRIVTRSWHTVSNYRTLLNPFRYPIFTYQLWSHKVIRWLSPIFLIVVLIANIALIITSSTILYWLALTGQFVFYMLAGIGFVADQLNIEDTLITHIPFYFIKSSYGMYLGLSNFIRGTNIIVWSTNNREQ